MKGGSTALTGNDDDRGGAVGRRPSHTQIAADMQPYYWLGRLSASLECVLDGLVGSDTVARETLAAYNQWTANLGRVVIVGWQPHRTGRHT